MKYIARVALMAGLVAWLPQIVLAGAPTEQLRTHIGDVLKVLEDSNLRSETRAAERRSEIRRIASQIFDFTEMTRRALGPHWQARTAAEKKEVVELFTALLERSYVGKIDLYNGERIVWTGEAVDGDLATVRTRIVTRQGSEIPVDYRLLRRNGRWATYDVTIEGVSLIANYRTQFNKIIQGGSYAELVKRLHAKVDERPKAAAAQFKRTSQQ